MFIKTTLQEFLNENLNNINIKIYTGEEFLDIYYDNRTEINKFKYFDIKRDSYGRYDVYFFVLYVNDKIVGLAHIRKSPHIENTYWLSYLSILNEYENKGYASKLSEYIIKWFSENNIQFETSSYSEMGYIKLKPLFNKLTKKYNVSFIDKETKI